MNINRYLQKQISKKDKLTLEEAAVYIGVSKRTVLTYVSRYGLKRHFGRGTGMQGYYLKSEIDDWYRQEKLSFRIND